MNDSPQVVKVAIIGAAGYTGQALLEILLRHPLVEVVAVTSDSNRGTAVAQKFPAFAGSSPLVFDGHESCDAIAREVDTLFLCLPHTESMGLAKRFAARKVKIIDLSADFRISDAAVYEEWYGVKHSAPELLEIAVYALPELRKGEIADADLIASPGCYPTSTILALAPIIGEPWVDSGSIVVNSASGVSGAGKKPNPDFLLAELEGNFYAYAAPHHRHTPEIEQELSLLASKPVKLTFIPHLLPTARGIYTTITLSVASGQSEEAIRAAYRAFYAASPFVTVIDGYPKMKWAVKTNNLYLGLALDQRTDTLIITSTIDNLMKGASGQAVQSFNIRHGFAERMGL